MGHVEDGKQWLYPEEALFLIDEVSAIIPTVTCIRKNTDRYAYMHSCLMNY